MKIKSETNKDITHTHTYAQKKIKKKKNLDHEFPRKALGVTDIQV